MMKPDPRRSSSDEEPRSDTGRRLALGLTAGSVLIVVAVGAMLLVVLTGIWLVRLYLGQFS
jgi:hypothetical protein